jgi:23S rRNA (uridine2552-2'-O)-methyltransferase
LTKQRVKTSKGRKIASTRWIYRQINDPFVQKAKVENYRARSVYKLIEINKKFSLIKKNFNVLDVGAAPGSWSQYVEEVIGDTGKIFALDKHDIDPIKNVNFIKFDLNDDLSLLNDYFKDIKFDLIISDLAPNSSGNNTTDSIISIALNDMVMDVAENYLKPGGNVVLKMLRGSDEEYEHKKKLTSKFKSVKYFKPAASRKESTEIYLILLNYNLT